MSLQRVYIYLVLLFFLSGCQLGRDKVKKETDNCQVSVVRLDKLLNEYVELNSFSALQKLNTEYAVETKILIEDIWEIGQVNDDNVNIKIKEYLSDSTLQTLLKDALLKYDNMESIEKEMSKGFRKLKEEFPDITIPLVYSQFSALNGSVVVGDSILGFSIDKYMGEDYPIYKKYYYAYQRKSMEPERIVPDCFNFYLMGKYPFPDDQKRTLLNLMLYNGKINYIVTKILDYKSFEEEIGFTKEESEWLARNKKSIWNYMVGHAHIFATDPMIVRRYLQVAPYTAFFGDDSPPMIGIWIGTQIIDSYMKNNKNMTLEDLINHTDFQEILNDAKFKP